MSLTKVTYSMIQGAQVNVLDFGADPTGAEDSTAAIQAALDTGNTVWIPEGTYLVTSLDLRGIYPNIIGDGIDKTIIKASESVAKLINAYESSDVQNSPVLISNMTIDGDDLVTEAILSIRYRHFSNINGCVFKNASATGAACIFAIDAWLNIINNCKMTDSYNGLDFHGSNHRSTVNSCSFTGCSNAGISCNSDGTAADGNMALVFNNCDVEFGTGLGVYLDVSSAAFYGCYIGENISGASFYVDNGNILIESGVLFYGYTTNSFALTGTQGNVDVRNATVSGQTNGSVPYLMSGDGKNTYRFQDCDIFTATGGNPVVVGNVLDYGPQNQVFCERLGKNWTATTYNTTATSILANTNGRRNTCNSVTGATPIIGLQSTLVNNDQWLDGQNLYLILVYKASTVGTLSVKLSGGSFGVSPTVSLGTPPNASVITTYIKLDQTASNAAYTIIEFLAENCAANDYIEIEECYLADNTMVQKNALADVRNLYKC